MTQITVTGLEPVLKKLGTIAKMNEALRAPMNGGLMRIQRKLMVQPRKAKGAFTALATDRQRRAYWARVGRGEINHRDGIGYVRTHTLSKAWTTQIVHTADGMRGEVGNIQPYAKYVQGDTSTQQLFHHASGWKRIDTVAQQSERWVQRNFRAAILKLLDE